MKNLKYLLLFAIVFACQPDTDSPTPIVDDVVYSVAKTMEVTGVEIDLEIEGESNARGHWRSRCTVPEKPKSNCEDPDVITFDDQGLVDGDFVSSVEMGGGTITIAVEGVNVRFPGDNAAMIFDSNNPNPAGDDLDLGTPNEAYGGPGEGDGGASNQFALNNMLIVSEDLDPNDPDDDNWSNGKIYFDFSDIKGGANIISLDVVDIDEGQADDGAYVSLLDENDNEIARYLIPATGDNGYARLDLEKTAGVYKMIVKLNGSGAIDNLSYCYGEVKDCGCTHSHGYWKKDREGWEKLHNGQDSKFFCSGQTWHDVLTCPVKGNAYYILSKQYVAAVLNIKNGACAPDLVKYKLMKATMFFMWYKPSRCNDMSERTKRKIVAIADYLEKYNTGVVGPGHCD